jgi:hypothetical protein
MRRLMATANEEGGIRIVDVDVGMGVGGMEGGWWWRGHSNAVFDMKWSGDDTKVVSGEIFPSTPCVIAMLMSILAHKFG